MLKKGLYLLACVSILSAMAGCRSQSSIIKNRENRYLQQSVRQLAVVSTPKGMQKPALKSAYVIPKGPRYYPPNARSSLQPPHFNAPVQGPKASQRVKGSKSAIQATLSFDKTNHGLLTIDTTYDTAWTAVGKALSATNYSIVSSDKANGLYHVSIHPASGKPLSYLVYVNHHVAVVHVSIFDMKHKLSSDNTAYSLLEQIKANL